MPMSGRGSVDHARRKGAVMRSAGRFSTARCRLLPCGAPRG
jgi:hypothetical protein